MHFTPVSDAPVCVVFSVVMVNAMLLDACFGCADVNLTTSRNLDTPPLSGRGLFVAPCEVFIRIWNKITAVINNFTFKGYYSV